MLIDGSVYKDLKFKEPIEKDENGVISLLCFGKIKDLFDRDNLIRASFSDLFFESFVYQSKNPIALFNKDFASITVFQSKLLAFSNILLNKLRNIDKIPDHVTKDAVKLYNYDKDDKASKENTTEGMSDLKEKMKKKGQIDSDENSSSEEEVSEYVGKPKYIFDKYKEIIKTKRINKRLEEKRAA